MYHLIRIGDRTIESLRNCKLIVRCGVGFDNADGAAVANVPDYGTEGVADTAIGMGLALARAIHFLDSRLRRGEGAWTDRQAQPVLRSRGRTFGIIGIGRIGTALALRAKALGMKVAFHDPLVPDGYVDMRVKRSENRRRALLGQPPRNVVNVAA